MLVKKCTNPNCNNPKKDINGELSLDCFSYEKKVKSGKYGKCKFCVNAVVLERLNSTPSLRDAKNKAGREKYAADPLSKEKVKIRMRKWSRNNREKVSAKSRAWREANPEKAKATSNMWKSKNKPHLSEYRKKYRKDNLEKETLINKAWRLRWREKNPKVVIIPMSSEERKRRQHLYYINNRSRLLEKSSESAKKRRKDNPEKAKEIDRAARKKHPEALKYFTAQRRAMLKNAIPPWLSFVEKKKIRSIYKNCKVGNQVDHIVPLKAIDPETKEHIASGLHVPWNLQYLTTKENIEKKNRLYLRKITYGDFWKMQSAVSK